MKDAFSTAALSDGLTNSNGLANAEKELGNHFKAAALSIATLYKASLATSKQAYNAGYLACLMDLQTFMHAGVSIQGEGEHASNSEALSIERVMDWVDGRLEALRGDEDDSDDDKEREGGTVPDPSQRRSAVRPRSAANHPPASSGSSRAVQHPETKLQSSRLERRSSTQSPVNTRSASPPLSPVKPPNTRKERVASLQPFQHYPFGFIAASNGVVEFPLITGAGAPQLDGSPLALSAINITPDAPISVGSKRRHSTLVDQPQTPASRANGAPSNAPRRRARHSRVTSSQGTNSNVGPPSRERTNSLVNAETGLDAMEVEERPRKTARR